MTMLNCLPVEGRWTDDYHFEKCIGEGHVGKAYRAIDVLGQATEGRASKEVVIKLYSDDKAGKQFKREVDLMHRVSGHPNVVQLLASHSVTARGIIMPFYGEVDLHDYVWECDGFSETQAASVTRDLLSALQHVHACGVIHRDVKPENMILGQDGKAVLLDFDVACYSWEVASPSGSPGYLAPELIEGKPCSFSSDLFSVGCVAYFMIAKVHPFFTKAEATVDDILDSNRKCELKFGRRFKSVSYECLYFISSLITRNPEHRLSGQQASTHPWLSEKEWPKQEERVPEMKDAAAKVTITADPSSSNDVPWTSIEKSHSLPAADRTGGRSSRKFSLTKAKDVGRSIVSKLARTVGKMRGNASKISPLGSKDEDLTKDMDSMTGVLIRD